MVVPIGILGAVAAATALNLENDVYFQVGLLVTIGLSSKNAILIVEFARDLEAQGKSAIEAAVEAAHLRLRPILMTSLAFVLGVLPLAIASGAGSGSQNAVGRGVIGGMLTATFLAPFLIPMFFYVITEKVFKSKSAAKPAAHSSRAAQRRRNETQRFCEPNGRRQGHAPQRRCANGCRCAGRGLLPSAGVRAARCTGGRDVSNRRCIQVVERRTGRHDVAGRRYRLARFPDRSAATATGRDWARKQPRPASRRIERGADAGAIPDPARRAVSASRRIRRVVGFDAHREVFRPPAMRP